MNNFKKCISEWEKLVHQYDNDAKEIQKKIAAILKKDWSPKKPRVITVAQMKKIVDRSGIFKIGFTIQKVNFKLEQFSRRAEDKLLRSNYALDSIMCKIEGELTDLRPNPPKKIKQV